MIGLIAIFAELLIAPVAAEDVVPPLAAYNADIRESSISGISSGAFMAVQFGMSWSSVMKGVGVIAGGPFYCAQGTAADEILGNLGPELRATGACMKGPPPALDPLFKKTDEWARRGDIDNPQNIAHQRIYIFASYNDLIVSPKLGETAYRFYLHYLDGRSMGNLFFQNAIGAGHSQVTMDYGLPCQANEGYFIDNCHYDQAGVILQHTYGMLNPKNTGALSGKFLTFDQRELTAPESPGSYSMAEVGYAYVPATCAAQQPCRVHIALHGCKQNFQTIQTRYIEHAGYNEWADSNHIVVLYPQTAVGDPRTDFGAPLNPFGCWDWWGYTNFNYAVKAGRQIETIKAMLDRVTSGHAPNRPSNMTAPTGLIVNDVSDTGIAVAWGPLAHAQQYTLARADGVTPILRPSARSRSQVLGTWGCAPPLPTATE